MQHDIWSNSFLCDAMISIIQSNSCFNLVSILHESNRINKAPWDDYIPAKGSIRARFLFCCLLFCTASTLDDSSSTSFVALRLVPAFST